MVTVKCDGCGRPVDTQHVTERLWRLELATQYRPVNIKLLFLADAPPSPSGDYFYRASATGTTKSVGAQEFFDAVHAAVGIVPLNARNEQASLMEFQRRGIYYAECVECPLDEPIARSPVRFDQPDDIEFAARFGNTVANRVQFSYKPHKLILLSSRTRQLLPVFAKAHLSSRLLLYRGQPVELPIPGDSASIMRFIVQVGSLVAQADSALVA